MPRPIYRGVHGKKKPQDEAPPVITDYERALATIEERMRKAQGMIEPPSVVEEVPSKVLSEWMPAEAPPGSVVPPEEEATFWENPTYWLYKRNLLPDFMFSNQISKDAIKRGEQGLPEEPNVNLAAQRRREELAHDPNPIIRLANTPTVIGGLTPADMVGLGILAYGGYLGVKSLYQITKEIPNKVLQKALDTGLDKWIAQRSRGVPPTHLKTIQNFLYNTLVQDKVWLQERATQNMLIRMGRGVPAAGAAEQAVADTMAAFDTRLPTIVPTATQTGAMAFGGEAARLTPQVWVAMSIADKTALVQSSGLSGRVASKAWEALTTREITALQRGAIGGVPEVTPVTPEVTKIPETGKWNIVKFGEYKITPRDETFYNQLADYAQKNIEGMNRAYQVNLSTFGAVSDVKGAKVTPFTEDSASKYLSVGLFGKGGREALQSLAKTYGAKQVADAQELFHEIAHSVGISEETAANRFSVEHAKKFLEAIPKAEVTPVTPEVTKRVMSYEERLAEATRLEQANRTILATPSPSAGEISPAQLGMMSKNEHAKFMQNLAKKIDIEARIKQLRLSDEELATREVTRISKETQGRISQLQRQIADLKSVGISSKTGKMRPTYQRAIETAEAELKALARLPSVEGVPKPSEMAALAIPKAPPVTPEVTGGLYQQATSQLQDIGLSEDATDSVLRYVYKIDPKPVIGDKALVENMIKPRLTSGAISEKEVFIRLMRDLAEERGLDPDAILTARSGLTAIEQKELIDQVGTMAKDIHNRMTSLIETYKPKAAIPKAEVTPEVTPPVTEGVKVPTAPANITTERELALWYNKAFLDATASIRRESDRIMQTTKGTYEERQKASDEWEQKELQPFKDAFMAKALEDAKARGITFTKLAPEVTPKPSPEAPRAKIKPVTEEVAPKPPTEIISKAEETAVTEITGAAPPKPPKDWDKIGGKLYDNFKRQVPEPTPSTVPLSDRILRAWPALEKFATDELARLNWLGWQAEVDSAMVRASSGQAAQLYRETMKSIIKSLGNDSNLVSYVDDYLMLRHQLEVLKATDRKYFTIKKGDVTRRFTAKQIGLLFQQMKKELGATNYAKVKEAASHVPAIYNQILKGTQELTPEQIEGLIKKYPWFNPTLFEKETTPININRSMSPRQIKQLTNLESDKRQITPLMSLPNTIAKRVEAQALNEARKSISEAAIDPKNARLLGGDVEIVTKKPEGAFIDYFDNGVRKYLKLGKGTEWLAKDIELLQTQPTRMLITFVRSIQNLSKMAFTTYNPGFVVWNTFFDGMTVYFAEGIGPWGFGKSLAGNLKAMFTDVPEIAEFRRAGGEMMGFFEKGKGVEKFIGGKGGQIVLKNPESLKRFLNPFEVIRELGLSGENAGRRAAYDKAIKEGLSPKEAALRGRRVTVDFSRFSTASRFINDWFIYFNPAVQGFLLPGRAIAKNPRVLWRLAALMAAYAGLTIYNQSYDEYKDVSDHDKVGKLMVMLPSDEYNKYGQKVPHYITVLPLREFALFTSPIEYFLGKLMTEEPEAYRTIGQELGTLYPIISPLSMISETGGIVMPTQIGATIQQILNNHDDFRDRPIVDDEMKLLPTAQQYDQYTDKLAIKVGQALNMSPKKLDFFVSSMFGAMGKDALRTIDWAIQGLDKEMVDERIAGLVNELRTIATTVHPSKIEITRETFLEGLSVEDRELVLNMERLPDDQIPFITSIFQRFFRDYGGQVYRTAKEKALDNLNLEDFPPEALEELQKASVENANNLIADKITKYQYDQNRSRYRAYYSGGSTAQWREAMIEGAVSRADVDKYMPESYKRAGEFQAVSAYMEIRQKYIDGAGGVFDSDTWDMIEGQTLDEMRRHYSESEIQYAIAHKDDWIDNLPEPARTIERERANAIEDESWWDDYRGTDTKAWKPKAPSAVPSTEPTGGRPIYRGVHGGK